MLVKVDTHIKLLYIYMYMLCAVRCCVGPRTYTHYALCAMTSCRAEFPRARVPSASRRDAVMICWRRRRRRRRKPDQHRAHIPYVYKDAATFYTHNTSMYMLPQLSIGAACLIFRVYICTIFSRDGRHDASIDIYLCVGLETHIIENILLVKPNQFRKFI